MSTGRPGGACSRLVAVLGCWYGVSASREIEDRVTWLSSARPDAIANLRHSDYILDRREKWGRKSRKRTGCVYKHANRRIWEHATAVCCDDVSCISLDREGQRQLIAQIYSITSSTCFLSTYDARLPISSLATAPCISLCDTLCISLEQFVLIPAVPACTTACGGTVTPQRMLDRARRGRGAYTYTPS
jgi:hypothetical protein